MGATPPEEITKQHAEACALVASRMPCAPRIDHGQVPLRWKERPTAALRATATVVAPAGPPPSQSSNPNAPDEGVEVLSRDGEGSYPEWCVSSRGRVDVAPLVQLIREGVNEPACRLSASVAKPKSNVAKKDATKGPVLASNGSAPKPFSSSNLWREQNAAQNNVQLTRPSHDAWGIKKIILVFCEDFLHTIYTLPWYQENNDVGKRMHAAVQPILDVLGIRQSQVVRCLLAGLPPGVTIPVHHDTGEWVRHTHRVHVPILVPDPDKVLFRCGPTAHALARIDCAPGHVFEMNNQAKHAVTNAGAEFRVHLILDYVDPAFFAARAAQNCPVQRVALLPGEKVTQTRRSIDRALDAGTRQHPSFLILGAQKAGTTSLYEALNQHPWIVRAKRRETHCLDWRWDDTLGSTAMRRRHCRGFYHAETMREYPSLRTGDSTPSYLLDYYRVIPRLKECFPHGPQLIITTRDPILRAASHHAMVTAPDGSAAQRAARGAEWHGRTLEEVCLRDLRHLREAGLLPYWDPASRTVDPAAFAAFADTREEDAAWERYVTTRVPLGTGAYAPLARGLYALQCRRWFRSFARDRFLVLRLEDMAARGTQWAADRALAHLSLPRYTIPDGGAKNAREYADPLAGEEGCRGWLERFFSPHNARFGRMMVEEMGYPKEDWLNVWSY